MNLPPEEVAYVALTGKAATVLAQKGCPNAMTAHKLLYKAKAKDDGTFFFEKKTSIGDFKLIVVDEVSMLPLSIWNDLLSHRIYVLALGDPYQLPTIDPNEDNHVLDHPHVFLDEIMRQAQESEIIRLSMHIRQGRPPATFPYQNKEVMIVPKWDVIDNMYLWADQVLCATNRKRNEINHLIRDIKGFGPEPEIGDKIIGLTNHWDFFANGQDEFPLTNGTICYIEDMQKSTIRVPFYISKDPITVLFTTAISEDGHRFERIPIDYQFLKDDKRTLTPRQMAQLRKNLKSIDPPFDFSYGGAITTHRAQGSQWDKVLVFEENFPTESKEHSRWVYTAVTRPAKNLIFVKK